MTNNLSPLEDVTDRTCFICNSPGTLRCKFCENDIWFCCQSHSKLHRPSDSEECYPYKVVRKPNIGRCLLATRRLNKGEVIYSEDALLVGPSPLISSNQCLVCRNELAKNSSTLCEGCGFPMCNEVCSQRHQSGDECLALNKLGCKGEVTQFYELILPLRVILIKMSDLDDYKILESYMDHNEERRNDTEHWQRTAQGVIEPLVNITDMKFDDVARILGIVEVNNYEIFNPGECGFRGIYPITSLMSHNCLPNTRFAMSRFGEKCPNVCIASRDIEEGEEITASYVHLHMNNSLRRVKLKENWYFDCHCSRCQDPTEKGTFLDGIKCQECDEGIVLPKNSLDSASIWTCDHCPNEKSSESCLSMVNNFLNFRDALNRSDIPSYIAFHDNLKKTLHENHYVLTSLRKWILPLYCRLRTNSETKPVTEEMLEKKIQMCSKYLSVLDQVEYGMTRNRGKMLYELADTRITLTYKRYRRHQVSDIDMMGEVKDCQKLLMDAVECLKFDEEGTFENFIFNSSQKLLKSLDTFSKYFPSQ